VTSALAPELLPSAARLRALAEPLRDSFARAEPYPHAVLDGVFADAVVDALIAEFPAPDDPRWNEHRHAHSDKLASADETLFGPVTRQLFLELCSARFVAFLETLSGIGGLIPDPLLCGAGLHQIEPGGFLEIHADFNRHPVWDLDRRLNVLLYLNRDWREEYGAELELWDAKMRRCVRRYAPLANRLVIFRATDRSYHGHPAPLATPPGLTRKSLAAYYYSNGRPAEERSAPHSTLYQPRSHGAERGP
jgi:hypothetical protein